MKLLDVSTPKHPNTFAKVDDEDFEFLNQWKWGVFIRFGSRYAQRTIHEGPFKYRQFLHRAIVVAPQAACIDHIDGDGLNNQRANLRPCSFSENMRNRRKHKTGSSKYKGVVRCRGLFRVRITINGKRIALGYFQNEAAAALAYNAAAEKYHGLYASKNNIGA